jgi:hypothetical protein
VIDALKNVFSCFGIPQIVIADSNPFGSYDFKMFSNDWKFKIVTTSPNYPRANGKVERTVQTAKKLIKNVGKLIKMYQVCY